MHTNSENKVFYVIVSRSVVWNPYAVFLLQFPSFFPELSVKNQKKRGSSSLRSSRLRPGKEWCKKETREVVSFACFNNKGIPSVTQHGGKS